MLKAAWKEYFRLTSVANQTELSLQLTEINIMYCISKAVATW